MDDIANVNSPQAVRARFAEGRIPQAAPAFMVLARPTLALVAGGLTFLVFARAGVPSPAVTVRNWWTVYGTLVDLGCLAMLFWLTKLEGIRLLDLISFDRSKLKVDVPLGLGIFMIVFPLTVFAGAALAGNIAYGSLQPVLPDGAFIRALPLWAVLYSRLLWWPIWSFTEELTFQGYVLPRLQALSGSTWMAVAAVTLGWAVQHSFLPWIDPRHGLFLFIMFVPLTLALQVVYLRVGRLTPLIIGHWLMDLTSVLFMLQVK